VSILHRAEALRDALRDAAEVMYLERTLSADNANSMALRMAEDRFAFSCRSYAEAIDDQEPTKQPENWQRRRAS
jgi:hypothetical protein